MFFYIYLFIIFCESSNYKNYKKKKNMRHYVTTPCSFCSFGFMHKSKNSKFIRLHNRNSKIKISIFCNLLWFDVTYRTIILPSLVEKRSKRYIELIFQLLIQNIILQSFMKIIFLFS